MKYLERERSKNHVELCKVEMDERLSEQSRTAIKKPEQTKMNHDHPTTEVATLSIENNNSHFDV